MILNEQDQAGLIVSENLDLKANPGLIFANILAPVLIEKSMQIKRYNPKYIIISGLLKEQEEDVLKVTLQWKL